MDCGAPLVKVLIPYQVASGQFPQLQGPGQQASPSMEVGITDMTWAGAPLEPSMPLGWCPLLWEGHATSTGRREGCPGPPPHIKVREQLLYSAQT